MTDHAAPPPRPPRWKQATVIWLGAFPLITVILGGLGPLMADWPLIARTFVVSVLMVVGLTWLILPALNRALAGWLSRA